MKWEESVSGGKWWSGRFTIDEIVTHKKSCFELSNRTEFVAFFRELSSAKEVARLIKEG